MHKTTPKGRIRSTTGVRGRDLRTIPLAPHAWPLTGHLVPLARDPLAFLKSLPAHGALVRVHMGPVPLVVICDPELTHQALVDDRVFDKGGPVFERFRDVLGDGLSSCPHHAHRRLRRLAQPAFHSGRLPGYARTMTVCLEEVTGSWMPGRPLDVPTEMMSVTSQVTAATLFSESLPAAERGQLIDDVKTIAGGVFRRMLLVPPLDRLPTPGNRAYLRARTRLRHTCDLVIAERRADGTDHGDLLSALVAARDPEDGGRGMTDAEISDTILTVFLAGTETTASTLAWALDLLARHPEIEQRLHTEVDTVLRGNPATHADLPRLELTERIINETLRLYPQGWFLTRTVTHDTHLGGHPLPAGASLAYSPYLIHHRPDLYNDPETFDPDRWDPKRPQPPRHAFIPFATGARKCIGDTFAMAEATLALATITARWRLKHLPGHHRTRPVPGASIGPGELRMQPTPR
ncbi:cytochrome P450 [Streptomyces lydicus]|uniref:Cytochrome P450 n=1 Tax=Streptomyces lydicus TaxID=47763 RepID=A0A3S9YKR2_9ACTN|nr:cytochrome P450 [Streptomyces lydicus]AZS75444.1 cytochrome P450 [Streptomyces lydicus]